MSNVLVQYENVLVLQNEVDVELSGKRVDREVLPIHAHLREEVQLVPVVLQQLQVVLRLLRDAYRTHEYSLLYR